MRNGLALGAALIALAACGRSGGDAANQAGAANAAETGGASSGSGATGNVTMTGTPGDVTISTQNGSASFHMGGAPAGLPEGVPAYPNASAGDAIDINGGSAPGQGRILGFSTPDAPAQVIAFYTQAVTAAGYTVANRMDMGATSTMSARRAEGQAVNVVATQSGGVTRVQIIVAVGAH